ncbi:hypothetical protein BGX21_001225 [Mortierella sp. AD011]|nr:hypothetical protein BGX20_005676 [Mortierella sp. AD010]KAF9384740.1 hypothetical protein BGX21_001225 [Mortierella sp. AD011]
MKSTFFVSTIAVVLGSFILPSTTNAIVVDTCTLAIAGLTSDSGLNTCLPITKLSTLATSNITASIVDSTLASFCPMPVCPSASITLVENTVKQSCVNSTDSSTSDLIAGVASLYTPAKDGLCQTVSSTNATYCATVLTQSMLDYWSTNPATTGVSIFTNSTALLAYVNAMPTSLLCTSCNKAIINPLVNYVSTNKASLSSGILSWASVIENGVQSKCGSDFVNGASTATPSAGSSSSTSAALSGYNSPATTVVMVVLLSAVALLF